MRLKNGATQSFLSTLFYNTALRLNCVGMLGKNNSRLRLDKANKLGL